jgi:hypothetical protein
VIAQAGQFGDYTYESSGSGVTIISYTGPGGNVTVPDTIDGLPVTSIGNGAFYDCTSLTSIVIPDSITEIGAGAFAGCTKLVDAAIPARVTRIWGGTFSDCANLVNISIPVGVESIGSAAFAGCISLTHVTIPESVTYFGTNRVGGVETFRGCTRLTAIDVNSQNPVYSSLNGVLLDKAQATIILYPGGKQGAYSAPGSVASIGPMAFNGCAGLTCITIPDSVTTIGYSAFSGCINLSSAMISESVIAIGHWAFHDCANLTRVYCGGAAPTLGAGVFYGATNTTVHFLPATTGWATMFGERPTALWVPIMLTLPSVPGDYMLKLVTHSPAPATVRVQRSVNLVDWEDWQTVSRDEGPSVLQDSDASTTPYRFYRGIEE